MNDIKQFISTPTGKTIGAVLVLGIGIFIGSHSSSKPDPVQQPVAEVPVATPIVVTPPATTAPKTTSVQTTPKKTATVVPTPAPVTAPVQTPAPAPTPPPAPAPVLSWHTVYTVSANTTKQTPPFTIQGKQWRVSWNCAYGNPTTPTIRAFSTSGNSVGTVASPDTCPESDTTYFYDGPDTYYFKISTYSDASISATVEDYY